MLPEGRNDCAAWAAAVDQEVTHGPDDHADRRRRADRRLPELRQPAGDLGRRRPLRPLRPLLPATASGKQEIVNPAPVGVADPTQVPAAMVAGGIGGVSDGTQVTHHVSSAVPGKPMAPIADDPAGSSTDEAQAMNTPASGAHAERGGSG